jgi:hypothetical protein
MKTAMIILTLAGLLVPVLAPFKTLKTARQLFWASLIFSSTSAFFMAYPPDWKVGIGWSLLVFGVSTFTAYMSTSYIKIGGKVRAFYLQDSFAEFEPNDRAKSLETARVDSYIGLTTAAKSWWAIVGSVVILMGCVLIPAHDKPWWLAPIMSVLLIVMAAIYGYGDASSGFPPARRQYLQFLVVGLISFGSFTVIYFVGYLVGKRTESRPNKHTRPD